jgi:uncharacterized protein YkwD
LLINLNSYFKKLIKKFPVLKNIAIIVLITGGFPASAQPLNPWNDSLIQSTFVTWLSDNENLVIAELNKVRSDPSRYAEEYIKPLLGRFEQDEPDIMLKSDGRRLQTSEGKKAVLECIASLKKTKPAGLLKVSKGLSRAARDHTIDQGKTGKTGHNGSDGSDPFKRMNRYGKWTSTAGENISYGEENAREIVLQLLIDDGVSSRGHRKNIMNPAFGIAGISCGSHKDYRWMATMDMAGGYEEK